MDDRPKQPAMRDIHDAIRDGGPCHVALFRR